MTDRVDMLSRERITLLIHSFYDEVRSDPDLAPVFNPVIGENWEPHLQRMVAFWSTVALGERSFRGNVFAKHMALEGVRPEHFLRWLTLWHKHTNALLNHEDAVELQEVAHGIGRNLFHGFFGSFARFVMKNGVADSWVPDHA